MRALMLVQSGQSRVYYETLGAGAEPMILVHGGLSDAELLVPLARELAHLRCIVLDRPGYRRSGRLSEDTTIEEQVAAIATVHDAATISPAWLFGHSSGANFALAYAMARPERVRGLVLVEPALYAAYPPSAAPPQLDEMRARVLPLFRDGDFERGRRAFGRTMGGVTRASHARLGELGLGPRLADNASAFAHDQPIVMSWYPSKRALERFDTPATVLEGSDTSELLSGVARIVARDLSAALELLPGCDHMAPVVAPKQTARAITSFIARAVDGSKR